MDVDLIQFKVCSPWQSINQMQRAMEFNRIEIAFNSIIILNNISTFNGGYYEHEALT